MSTTLRYAAAMAALFFLAFAAAQQPPPARTLAERVAALEARLASLDPRFGVQSARPPDLGGESGLALAARVTDLERSLQRMTNDMQRVELVAESAARDAAQAARLAMSAEQTARDVALRAR